VDNDGDDAPTKKQKVDLVASALTRRATERFLLNSDLAIVTYVPAFFDTPMSNVIMVELLRETAWMEETVIIFGKLRTPSRRVCHYGDPGVSYLYAGVRREVAAWPVLMLTIKREVEQYLGLSFNYALLNLYKDGKDNIGYHSDDETDLIPQSTIASLSFGAARDFLLRSKRDDEEPIVKVALANGSLLCMRGNTQRNYKHSVPIRKKVKEARINITFRQIRH
jgi:alkylated DNA repair dioxygenase AlkB